MQVKCDRLPQYLLYHLNPLTPLPFFTVPLAKRSGKYIGKSRYISLHWMIWMLATFYWDNIDNDQQHLHKTIVLYDLHGNH